LFHPSFFCGDRVVLKYLLFEFDRYTVKLKPTNGSKDNVSHAEFWSSAVLAERKNTVGRYLVAVGVITRGDTQAIAQRTQDAIPYILIVVQIIVLLLVFRALKADGLTLSGIGWQIPGSNRSWLEVAIGACVGVALGLLYVLVLLPLLEFLQRNLGDYVRRDV
jgi:hypothetical protein